MSVFSQFFAVAEADVISIWGKAISTEKVVLADLEKVLQWAVQNEPVLVKTIGQITSALTGAAPFLPPQDAVAVEVAVAGLNASMIGLNNITASLKSASATTTPAQAVVATVQAVNAVRAAVSSVSVAIKVPVAA